jgi:hypothetical protein
MSVTEIKPPAAGATIPQAPRPICPGCKQTIEQVDFYPYAIGTIALITAALGTTFRPVVEPGAAPEPEKSPLWTPGKPS